MTKKLLITLFILALFTSCETRSNANTFDEGVVINGVRWATRNVDRPGTFTENPEDFGMLFQWNRRKGWNAIDENVEGWNNTPAEGTAWYAENDPCPPGWRVPTFEELQSLYYAKRVWEMQNDVGGRLIGIAPNQIFLPEAGLRAADRGNLLSGGLTIFSSGGSYWSSTPYKDKYAIPLGFGMGFNFNHHSRAEAHSIRCVSIDSELSYPIISQIEEAAVSASLDGVVINGIRWATRNVDAPGTFADNPEDIGMYFQWNRRIGFVATYEGEIVEGLIADDPFNPDTEWYAKNDPCPEGWRMPTLDEFLNLFNLDNDVWARKNGVNGRLFGTAPYQIFLPAAGSINFNRSSLWGLGGFGGYWSSTLYTLYGSHTIVLTFNNDDEVRIQFESKTEAYSIRCVAIE